MKAVTIRCRDLMVRDWCCDKHGFPMQVTNVGDDYAYATFEGNEGDPWEFDDKDDQPQPIPLTDAFFKDNGWKVNDYSFDIKDYAFVKDVGRHHLNWRQGVLCIWFNYDERNGFKHTDTVITVKYVHQFQQVLRLAGLNEMANNFKV